jgi:hypothetical protein
MAADEYQPNVDPNRDPNLPPEQGQPYGQPPYGQPPYGQPPEGQPPYGGQSYGQPPYGQPPSGGQTYYDPNTGQYQGGQYGQDHYRGRGPQGPYGHGPRRPEKQDEKQGEKEQEKQQEKGAGMDEKYHRNPLGFVSWALIIIWLGVTLLLQNVVFDDNDKAWGVFAWGAGVIIIAEALLRLTMPRWRRGITGSLIWGAIAVGVGFGLWFGNWEIIGPIVVIAVGVGILLSRILPRR